MISIGSSGVAAILGAGAVAAAGVGLRSPLLATTGPLLVLAVVVEHHRRRVREEARSLARLLPPLVDGLIQHMRSGRSLAQSCMTLLAGTDGFAADDVAFGSDRYRQTIYDALAPMAVALRDRRTLGEAAHTLLIRDDPSVRLFAVTVQVLALNGGPAVPALQRLRHTLIGVVHGSEQAEAQASQSMASAGLMAMSPLVVAALIAALHRDAANLYLFEPVGAICVFTAISLSLLGWWWMQHNVAKLERQIT